MIRKIYFTLLLLLGSSLMGANEPSTPISAAYGTVGGFLPGVGLGYRFQGPQHGFDTALTFSPFLLADLKIQYLYAPHYHPGRTSFYLGAGAVLGYAIFDSGRNYFLAGPVVTFGWLFSKSFFDISPQYYTNQNVPYLSFSYGWLF